MEVRASSTTLLVICVILQQIIPTNTCGGTTHILISHQAALTFKNFINNYDYRKLITKHQDAFLAGSFYPDAFYGPTCANERYHNVSEDTHWAPFLNATVNYIRKLPQPWDESTEKLVVFMFGVVSHQTADILWHSLDIEQGFISTMANVNFHGSYQASHTAADFGGETVNLYMKDLTFMKLYNGQMQWYIPVDDLYNIYIEYYGSVKIEKNTIQDCSLVLLLELLGEMIAIKETYLMVASSSPFLINQLDNFFLGGIDDMSRWTQVLWNDAIIMLQNGTSVCNIPRNNLFINCNRSSHNANQYYINEKNIKTNGRVSRIRGLRFSIQDLIIFKAYRGVMVQPGDKIKKQIYEAFYHRSAFKCNKKTIGNNLQTEESENFKIYYAPKPYSELGQSLIVEDLDGDGNDELIAGAPGYGKDGSPQQGRVYIIHGSGFNNLSSNLVDVDNSESVTIMDGTFMLQSKYGKSLAVLDINLDGIKDLVVGAPAYSNNFPVNKPLSYNGIVFIHFGRQQSKMMNKYMFFFEKPNITIYCQSKYCNLGHSLGVVDVNFDGHPDLILGTPFYQEPVVQCGIVKALFSDSSYKGSLNINFESLKWSLISKQAYSWFGYNIKTKDDVLLISQPNYRLCERVDCTISAKDVQAVGKLHIFNIGKKLKLLDSSITGKVEFDMMGYSSDLGRPYSNGWFILAVSFPGTSVSGIIGNLPFVFEHAGVVILYNITMDGRQLTEISRFEGDRSYGRFGEFVKFEDINSDGVDDLMIGAPLRSEDPTDLKQNYAENGQMFVYYGGKNFPVGNATRGYKCQNSQNGISPCPSYMANLTLSYPEYRNITSRTKFGSNAVLIKTKLQNYLAVSVPTTNTPEQINKFENTGAIYIHKIQKPQGRSTALC